jgi:hypothetical protein
LRPVKIETNSNFLKNNDEILSFDGIYHNINFFFLQNLAYSAYESLSFDLSRQKISTSQKQSLAT